MKVSRLLPLLAVCAACVVPPTKVLQTALGPAAQARAGSTDPSKREILISGAAAGWRASLVRDNTPTGIWTLKPMQVFPQYATPELVGCDDQGTLWVMVSYSGKWTPFRVLNDGSWLGGLDHADVDPRAPGAEIYTGSANGNLYQVRAHAHGILDGRLIGWIPGHEIHTIVAGEVDASHAGSEVLVFTRPGGLWRLTPDARDGDFTLEKVCDLTARIRDAVKLPMESDGTTPILTAARDGGIRILRMGVDGPRWELVHHVDQGRGRLAVAPVSAAYGPVCYSTSDDGRIFRHERTADGIWNTETIHRGDPGPRGVAAGRFHTDPDAESVVIFGYGAKCELLTRTGNDAFRAETLFTDRDSGHWLCAAELDGRNETDEIALAGYGARIILLAREGP